MYFEVIINISDGKGPSGGFLGRSAQKQYFPVSLFISKMSVGRSVKLNYSFFSREHTLACSAHFNDTVAFFLSST